MKKINNPQKELLEGTEPAASLNLKDVLGRPLVEVDRAALGNFIQNKIVLLTGAGGSVGSELSWQIASFRPKILIILGQSETALLRDKNILKERFPNLNLQAVLANIRDKIKIDNLFAHFKPQIVIHAAAYKNIPILEEAPDEAVKTNIFGTLVLARAAYENQAENFVFLSTDKAIKPASVMGTTKRAAEMICLSFNKKGKTKFAIVRLVNILDSQGSVAEIFQGKIQKREAIMVTHPEMKRYFMLRREVAPLVLGAAAISQGGDTFILDPGRPVKIYDLAKKLIKLSGLEVDKDVKIIFDQPRPGESLFEEIATPREESTKYKNIFISRIQDFDDALLTKKIVELEKVIPIFDNKSEIIKILRELVPDYQPGL